MKTAVLADDGPTVDAYNLTVRERLPDGVKGLAVKFGLGVGRYQYGTVDHQIVGIGSRQTVVAIVDRTGQGQLQQTIGTSVHGAKSL